MKTAMVVCAGELRLCVEKYMIIHTPAMMNVIADIGFIGLISAIASFKIEASNCQPANTTRPQMMTNNPKMLLYCFFLFFLHIQYSGITCLYCSILFVIFLTI